MKVNIHTTVDSKILETAKKLGINVSHAAELGIALYIQKVHEQRATDTTTPPGNYKDNVHSMFDRQ